MSQSEFTYLYSAGSRRDVQYSIGVRADPNLNNVESFAAILFFELEDGTRVQVAKVDDSSHEGEQDIHVDRYYRDLKTDAKEFNVDIDGYVQADERLEDKWKQFVDRYYENHGHEPRDDGANI